MGSGSDMQRTGACVMANESNRDVYIVIVCFGRIQR